MKNTARALVALVGLTFVAALACRGAQTSAPLTYRLTVKPGDITLPVKPATGSTAQQEETITFTVLNSSNTDYEGTAPSCQTFDIEIIWLAPAGEKPVWKWSQGQMFCQAVTTVIIPAGLDWHQTVKWDFAAGDVKPGKYRVGATFIPSNSEAAAGFEIH